MPDELVLLTFRFEETVPTEHLDVPSDFPPERQKVSQLEAERSAVQRLNANADELARDIEHTVERVLARVIPPPLAVQADINFSVDASIELAGMVVMWLIASVAPPVQKELGNLVQTAVRRVVNRALSTDRIGSPFQPIVGNVSSLNMQFSSATMPPALGARSTPTEYGRIYCKSGN